MWTFTWSSVFIDLFYSLTYPIESKYLTLCILCTNSNQWWTRNFPRFPKMSCIWTLNKQVFYEGSEIYSERNLHTTSTQIFTIPVDVVNNFWEIICVVWSYSYIVHGCINYLRALQMTWLGTASRDKHICGYNNKLFSALNEIFSNFALACAEMREVISM